MKIPMIFINKIILGLMLVAFSLPSNAILNIEITKGAEGALPIAIIPFAWEGPGSPPQDVAGIVSADLGEAVHLRQLPLISWLLVHKVGQRFDFKIGKRQALKTLLLVGSN